jgi:hypothetical protein
MTKRDGPPGAPIDEALSEFRAGTMTAEAAAEAANIPLYEMLDRIREAKIPYRLDREVFAALDAASDDQDPGTAIST